jgi:hydrogenase maturation factor
LHQVVEKPDAGTVAVEDLDGRQHHVSLLALDGPPPHVGEWLVVHSGYAIDRVSSNEADAIAAELRGAEAFSNSVPSQERGP